MPAAPARMDVMEEMEEMDAMEEVNAMDAVEEVNAMEEMDRPPLAWVWRLRGGHAVAAGRQRVPSETVQLPPETT